MKKLFVNKRNFALLRAVLAVVLAAAVVFASGFAFVYQFGGAEEIRDGGQLAEARYVKTDVKWIMDVCGKEVNSAGEVLYYYAVSPIGNRFVLFRFGANLIDDLTALETATMDYMTGKSLVMDFHLPVRGMVEKAAPGAYSLLSEWFNGNIEWMAIAGVVGENPSAAEYLSNELILVDRVGSMHWLAALGMTVLAALLVLYAVVELLLIAGGFYKDSKVAARVAKRLRAKKEKEKAAAKAAKEAEKKAEEEAKAAKEAATEEKAEAAEPAETEPEKPAEDKAEETAAEAEETTAEAEEAADTETAEPEEEPTKEETADA